MRTLAYLTHALALRQQMPAPDPSKCNNTVGMKGAVYICQGFDCGWYSPPKSPEQLPTLIGPDFGGHCHVYSDEECRDENKITLLPFGSEVLPDPK
ncbi:hypothetical protein N0V90_005099 [Kalmusia sp. IMI 367209]|nr:hypothetical protein N0V90_005099 [Kalmusia sp. IMI 367209]